MLETFLINSILQLLFCVGIISLMGLFIWRFNKSLFHLLGNKYGNKVFRATGIIGVPIHEFGHVIFCVIFFHKIKTIKWFQPNSKDGTLGYVHHLYNKKNIYQQIGNFFIGIGPLFFGSAAIILLMYIFLPNSAEVVSASKVHFGKGNFTEAVIQYFDILWGVFLGIFDISNFIKTDWWVFIILACSIALHMNLSVEDIKGSVSGLLYICVFVFIINIILCIFNHSWAIAVTNGCLWLSVSVVSFMAIAILLLMVLVCICAVIKLRFKKKNPSVNLTPEVIVVSKTD